MCDVCARTVPDNVDSDICLTPFSILYLLTTLCAVSQCVNLTPFYSVCALFYSVCALCVFVAQVDTSTVYTWARQGALLSAGARL